MDFKEKAHLISQKIRHLILTSSGRPLNEASAEEFYFAFCTALREEVMIHWTASLKTFEEKKPRAAYFLSLEYLPGRFFSNNITNMAAQDLVQGVLQKLNRNFEDIAACESDPGLGNGGLGRLASCFLDSLATLHYPAFAYGLRYQYGIFEQELWRGAQIEKPDCWLLNANPWEVRHDVYATTIHYRGHPVHAKNRHGDDVHLLEDFEEVRALPYDLPILGYSKTPEFSVLTLRLWSTKESPRNFHLQKYNAGLLDQAAENTSLTDVLYPNDNTELGKRMRLKQEFLLVSASLQDILRRHLKSHGDLSHFAEKIRIQLNDTHPALLIAELVRTLMKNFEFSWKDAVETARICTSYTNHTILKEALEEWNEHRLNELLPRQHLVIQKLNWEFCDQIRAKVHQDEELIRRISILENGQVRMAELAIWGCHKINGVAKLHSEILKEKIFRDFFQLFPEKFTNVTNGVTQRRWLLHANPMLSHWISEKIGSEWILDFSQMEKLKNFAANSSAQEEFCSIKKKNKESLLHFLSRENPVRDGKGKVLENSQALHANALFDVHIKRIHEYKRQLLNAIHLIMVYQELLENPEARPICRLSIFGGKAAPGYEKAKHILRLIAAVSRTLQKEEKVKNKLAIILIENYSVSKAEKIIPAADLSEQISTAGWEASGTGNMKLAINGALTIGTEDGANIEMREAVGDTWWPFRFGKSSKENESPHHPWEIYQNDEKIRNALDTLKNGIFSETDEEHAIFSQLYTSLVESDPFRLLQDLPSYYATQKKVEELYLNPSSWAEFAIHNMAAMGYFSTDRSIHEYAKNIWEISPCPLEPKILAQVKKDYAEETWLGS